MRIDALWQQRDVLVCVGTGGVGKTTVAAALAMAAAQGGRRVLVMTIDPSRRLAQSLGIDANHGDIAPIRQYDGGGSVHALVLDVQRTFDQLVTARAKNPAQAEAIMRNRIYQHFSASLAGSHEYAAVEKLWDAVHDARFDLVILDTPPAQNALDFLEAPARILQFLQGQALFDRVPGSSLAARVGRRLFDLGGGFVKNNVAKIAGSETLDDVLAFLRALSDMYDSFCERASGVETLLRSERCAFALVASTGAAQADAIARFEQDLSGFGITPCGYVLNRLQAMPVASSLRTADAMATLTHAAPVQALGAADREALSEAVTTLLSQARNDAQVLQALAQRERTRPVFALYEQAEEVDAPEAIERLAQWLRTQAAASSDEPHA